MKFFISLFIFCMILFLLLFSFRYHTGEPVSETDEMGAALTDNGIQIREESADQMQEKEIVNQAQQDGTTVLDEAVNAGKEEVKRWEESSLLFLNHIWENTKQSAYRFAFDLSDLFSPMVLIEDKSVQASEHIRKVF